MKQSRTHNCGELRLCNAGENVTLVGWLENVREVGANFAFCVLRDFYGTTQFVIENEEMMKAVKPLNKETTISVTGVVRERESKNNKIPTGEIEVVPILAVIDEALRSNLSLSFRLSKTSFAMQEQKSLFFDCCSQLSINDFIKDSLPISAKHIFAKKVRKNKIFFILLYSVIILIYFMISSFLVPF